jgi:hypothetical protein
MSKNKIMFTVAGFLLAVAIAIPARAGHEDKKSCGGGGNWDLVKVWKARCEHEAKKIDKDGNRDDYVCEKYRYGNIKYRDNYKDKD